MKYLTLRISNMNKSSWKMTLIFCKSGQMDHAKNVLEEMLSSDLPINQGAYTSVVHWLCIHSRFDSALRFIKKMLLRNLRPGEGLLTLLVGGLCKTGKHTEAMELWFRLLEKGIAANTVTSNALIHGLCELGDMQKAVKLLKEMLQKSLGLDKITYNTLILSFCREEKLEEAFKPKGDMIKRRFHPEVYTYSLLLHGFYSLLTDKSRDNNLDQRQSRFGLARMIILHGYPLTTVEDVGFRVGVKNLQPLFELVTCVRIEADCMEVYAKEKQKVYEMLDKLPGKISLSADVWAVSSDSKASGDSKNLCLTAHYIDEDWQLKKTTFNFIPIEPSHTEDMHSEFILTCLMDWDIDRKLFPVTVDSRTSSDNMKSPRNFHDGVVGLGIVAAMNDLGSTHEPIFSAKSPRTRPISIVSSAKPVVKLGVLNMEIENSEVDELSESYTCVISHFGDNLVKKRVYFDDDKLENYSVFFAASSPMDIGGEFWSGDFLSSYFLCKKQLRGLDIFMYIHIPILVDLPWIV
ncbi:hypothetical protein ACOSQ3_002855 [Xanthoceras sorbifolium]